MKIDYVGDNTTKGLAKPGNKFLSLLGLIVGGFAFFTMIFWSV